MLYSTQKYCIFAYFCTPFLTSQKISSRIFKMYSTQQYRIIFVICTLYMLMYPCRKISFCYVRPQKKWLNCVSFSHGSYSTSTGLFMISSFLLFVGLLCGLFYRKWAELHTDESTEHHTHFLHKKAPQQWWICLLFSSLV